MKQKREFKFKLFFAFTRLVRVLKRYLIGYIDHNFVCGECKYLDSTVYMCGSPKNLRGMSCGIKTPACEYFWPKPEENENE